MCVETIAHAPKSGFKHERIQGWIVAVQNGRLEVSVLHTNNLQGAPSGIERVHVQGHSGSVNSIQCGGDSSLQPFDTDHVGEQRWRRAAMDARVEMQRFAAVRLVDVAPRNTSA
jgi:hypothetical protein